MRVKIVRHPDCEGNVNRGFTLDVLELFVDDLPAGYLKIGHIPFHRILHWNDMDKAMAAIEFQAAARGMTSDELVASGERLGLDPLVSQEEFQEAWWNLDDRGNLKDGGTVAYHVDKPYVDYIRVYKPGDFVRQIPIFRFRNPDYHSICVEQDYRRKGLGTLLYVEGARWMAERGMLLHASDTRSDDATKTWDSIGLKLSHAVREIPSLSLRGNVPANLGDVSPSRIVLDGSLLKEWQPTFMTIERQERVSGRAPSCLNYEDLPEDMAERFIHTDRELRSQGIEPLGGELFPISPSEALVQWEIAASQNPSF